MCNGQLRKTETLYSGGYHKMHDLLYCHMTYTDCATTECRGYA